jgi:hypothetical protein
LASDGVVEGDPEGDADGAGEQAGGQVGDEERGDGLAGVVPSVRRMAWLRALSWAENTAAMMALMTARAMRKAAMVNPRVLSRSKFAMLAAREIGSGSWRDRPCWRKGLDLATRTSRPVGPSPLGPAGAGDVGRRSLDTLSGQLEERLTLACSFRLRPR